MTVGFEAWNMVYAPPGHAGIDKPLAPGSVFLFEDVMLPHFHVAPSGWDWFDSPRDLAGYLLLAGLPDLAGWLFDQTTTFGGPPKRLPLGETVAWAAEATDASRWRKECKLHNVFRCQADGGRLPSEGTDPPHCSKNCHQP